MPSHIPPPAPAHTPPERPKQISSDDGAQAARPQASEPGDAAALTADLIRRGRNPWWGKDQPAEPPARPATAPTAPGAAGTAARFAPSRRTEAARETRPRTSYGIDRELWRDVFLFLAVFAAASAAMLYIALRAL